MPRDVDVVLTANVPSRVHVVGSEAGPDLDVMSVGHIVSRDFLRFQRDNKTDAQLRITLVLRSPSVDIATDESWRNLCAQIYCDLRAYLMAQGGALAK